MRVLRIHRVRIEWLPVYGVFTLPESDSDKMFGFDNVTVHFCGNHIRIGSRIAIGIGQCAHFLNQVISSFWQVLLPLSDDSFKKAPLISNLEISFTSHHHSEINYSCGTDDWQLTMGMINCAKTCFPWSIIDNVTFTIHSALIIHLKWAKIIFQIVQLEWKLGRFMKTVQEWKSVY